MPTGAIKLRLGFTREVVETSLQILDLSDRHLQEARQAKPSKN
jgi:hypothetical protein